MAGAPILTPPHTDGPARRDPRAVNVGDPERLASGVIGGVLVLAGLRKRSLGGAVLALVGGDLVRRGMTGRCEVYRALGVSTADGGLGGGATTAGAPAASNHVEASVTVRGDPAAVYRAFRDPHTIARLLGDSAAVRVDDPAHEHWTVRGPFGRDVVFDTEYVEDRPGEVIRWRTRPGALVPHDGAVRFAAAPNDWGTEVRLSVRYDPPGGAVGDAAARLLAAVPHTLARRTLRRFKSLVETGELPTLAHNPSGRRDTAGGRAGGADVAGYAAGGTHVPLSDHTT